MSRMLMKRIASSAMNFLIQGTKIGTVTFLTLNYVGGFVVCYGPSMEPTLRTRDILLTEHISPRFKRIDIGDVVVARSPQDHRCVCKRVVAGPGDTVLYKNDMFTAWRKGAICFSSHRSNEDMKHYGFLQFLLEWARNGISKRSMDIVPTVPEDCVWLEGDNKGNSNDSRYYGPVPYSMVRRRCFCKVWPELDLSLSAGNRHFSESTPEMQQRVVCREEELHVKEDALEKNQQQTNPLEQGESGRGCATCCNNNGLCDKTNVERVEMFSLMKTSDTASSVDSILKLT